MLPEFFIPGTFEEEPPRISPAEAILHQGGMDRIDPAFDAANPDVLDGAYGYDPADFVQPSLEQRESIEKGLPQWGPPFVKFVDERITHLEKAVEKAIQSWSFKTQTYVIINSVQSTATGGLDQQTTPNCILITPQPGFTFALHRLGIFADGSTFAVPFNAAGGYLEIRVNNEPIDGISLVAGSGGSLPKVFTWGTRDAPRIRDGEVLSVFMNAGPISKKISFKAQGSFDRTIEG